MEMEKSEFYLECKAAYLSVLSNIKEHIQSRSQLVLLLQQAGRNPSKKALDKYWREGIVENLGFADFCDICKEEPVTCSEDLIKAFQKIDANGDGYISHQELYKIMTTKGEKMSHEEVRKLINEVDENKDGKLNYGEFCRMLIMTAEECKQMARNKMEKGERHLREGKKAAEPLKYPKRSPRIINEFVLPPAKSSKKLSEPKNLQQWLHLRYRGCFFLEDGEIISHQYHLKLREDSNVWITIQPIQLKDSSPNDNPIDTILHILRGAQHNGRLVTFTEQRDKTGKYGVRCDLSAGEYFLLPFTTGCRFFPRLSQPNNEVQLVKSINGNITLTKSFRKALDTVFDLCDLDCNGLVNKKELSLFNLRTSGEEFTDEEWQVVLERFDLENEELTRKGFHQLHEMEAEDNNGDTEDLWITLDSMGFNKKLELDEVCQFEINIYVEECCKVELVVAGLSNCDALLEEAVCDSVISKGNFRKLKKMRDLLLFSYTSDTRATLVLQNKSKTEVKILLSCVGSKNCASHHRDMTATLQLGPGMAKVAHNLLPQNEEQQWSISCVETIL